MKKILYLLSSIAVCSFMLSSCESSELPLFDATKSAARFPMAGVVEGNMFPGYANGLYSLAFSFVDDMSAEEKILDVPVVVVGNAVDNDRVVNFKIDNEKSSATAEDYEVISAMIPAGEIYGAIKLRLPHSAKLDSLTLELFLTIDESEDLLIGPDNYINAKVMWNGMINPPTTTATKRSYNMMIQAEASFISTSLAKYSPAAHKTILAATGWKTLPSYTSIYAGELYKAYAAKVVDYIATYNAAHPDAPLVHDAGTLKGQPIVGRKY